MQAVPRLMPWFGASPVARAASPADGEDWRLLRAANQGDGRSARQLVHLLTPQAHGLALRLLGRSEDAEDVVQEAFMRLWKSAAVDGHGARLASYFNAIVINRCRSMLRARREWATDPAELGQLHDELQSQGRVPGSQEVSDAAPRTPWPGPQNPLAMALARLPVRQRMAITMWAYADASVCEIAEALELDANATHQLLYRARQTLRQHLEGVPR